MRIRCSASAQLGPCLRLLALSLAVISPTAWGEDDERGFKSLFDGKDLKGWRILGGRSEAWSVDQGCIISRGEGGGWLGTESPHANFVLRLEYKLSSGSNSGVYLRAPSDTSHISRTGMEIQILDETHERHRNIKDWQRTGAIYHVAAPKTGFNKPIGEWNRMEITADGPRVVVRLNGEVVVDDRIDKHPELDQEHPGLKRRVGLIGLQSHNDRVEFRNLRLQTLPGSDGEQGVKEPRK